MGKQAQRALGSGRLWILSHAKLSWGRILELEGPPTEYSHVPRSMKSREDARYVTDEFV